MRQIIHNYKLRLTNLSQSNRSLKLGRLTQRRDVDLIDLGFLHKLSPEEILQRILAHKDITLLAAPDPRHEPTNLADRRLNKIYREVNTIFEETGTYDLFVGYPFVEGKFLDGTIARCPVLLFPVHLERNLQGRPRWKLLHIPDEPVQFNKTFFLAYEQFQEQRLSPEFWEEEMDPNVDWLEWLNGVYEKIKAYEIGVNFNSALFEQKLHPFPNYLKATMDQFPLGKLTFQPHAVLGIFPQSDSALLQDYRELEKNLDRFDWELLFDPEKRETDSVANEKSSPTPSYIKEEERYFVTPVDDSQEQALLHIKQGNSLVIHGPPGTGKSQVIVNLIADAMAHGKKVLLVSQKRAALDVVYKRLQAFGLHRFTVLIHDYRHDRKAIYQKIRENIEDIDLFQQEINDINITRWEYEYQLLSRQTDQLTRKFGELYDALTHNSAAGIPPHDLYLQTPYPTPGTLLSVAEVARHWEHAHFQAFQEKLQAVLDYRDFFAQSYPWKKRISFHHFNFDDRAPFLQRLQYIPQQVTQLHEHYLRLKEQLGPRLLEIELNQQRIRAFKKVDEFVNNHVVREGMEALHLDSRPIDKVQEVLDKMDQMLEDLDQCTYLTEEHWRIYGSLVKHVKNYETLKGKAFKYLQLSYLQSRWFLKRILGPHDESLTETSFGRLRTDLQKFQRLHQLYSKEIDYSFTGNFPLLDQRKEKRQWLTQKEQHLHAYRELTSITYFPKVKPRFSYDKFDMAKWQQAMYVIDELEAFTQHLQYTSHEWRSFLHEVQIEQLKGGIKDISQAQPYWESLARTFQNDFWELKSLDSLLANFTVREMEALALLEPQLEGEMEAAELLQRLRDSVYYYWIEQAEQKHPVLAEVSGRGWERKRKLYEKKLQERRAKVGELVRRKIKESLIGIIEYNRLKNPVTYRNIHHQVRKKRRLWSVRKLIRETWEEGLPQLIPCWMASPESVSAIFPMKEAFFDLVIFDEASQCFVEKGVPVMLRGKQCVIAGDEQQLQPLDLYKVRYEDAEAAFAEHEIALEVESILDLGRTSLPTRKLRWHYRSQEEALINFSNLCFYEGQLIVIPPVRPHPVFSPPITWISVAGQWHNNQNIPEAQRVIALILELVQHPHPPSIGIVTFNYPQQELIRDLLDKELEALATSNPNLFQHLYDTIHRSEKEEYQGLFVKNIENVQGDERDVIIFSIGYGYQANGKIQAKFGLLNQQGGANRLNVAVTRARLKIYVVCSFDPADLHTATSTHAGPRLLKQYLSYVKAVSEGNEMRALQYLGHHIPETDLSPLPNPIADYLSAELEKAGYTVERHLGDTSYKLDMAVKSTPHAEEYLLGIECEGGYYFRGASSKEREVYRPSLLRQKGWKIHRVWARNFWKNKEGELDIILKKLS